MNHHLRTVAAALVATLSIPAMAEEPQPEAAAEAPAPKEAPALPVHVEARPAAGEPVAFAAELPAESVAPESTIVVSSDHALVDLRVRLLDEGGKLVPTRDRATIGKGTVYEVRPAEPLVTGTAYRLEIDGQRQRQPSDVAGTAYAPQSFAFRTAGEKPAPPPPPAKKAAKAKRGRRR